MKSLHFQLKISEFLDPLGGKNSDCGKIVEHTVKGVGGVKGQKHKWGLIYRVFPPLSHGFGKIEKFQAVSKISRETRKEKSTFWAKNRPKFITNSHFLG